MTDTFIKPKFTQAEIEEFGELLDIARFLLKRVIDGDHSGQWNIDHTRFEARREAFIELVYGRLNPGFDREVKR